MIPHELKILKKDYILYGAKNKALGSEILEYTKKNEKKEHKHCVYENISWFAGLEQAKHYNGKNDLIFNPGMIYIYEYIVNYIYIYEYIVNYIYICIYEYIVNYIYMN